MFEYLKGRINAIESNYIVLETNNIGFKIYTALPYSFNEGDEYKVYIYQHIREDENTLFGFKTKEDKSLFLKLIDVKGLGPKMALPMLATGSTSGIIDAIERENILYLKKFPKIGDKVARQIILDLKGKLVSSQINKNDIINDELTEALVSLGYKNADIKKITPKVDSSLTIEDQIKEALKLLLK
ncbi:MAG: Holliday junction branch migration protein RuvA [Bacilli bacterium]|nr:Holliday junction branch migration protein RuvA [Bacilli bacterium]